MTATVVVGVRTFRAHGCVIEPLALASPAG
jgi:hypothetical protein